jgi:hypothetical protein
MIHDVNLARGVIMMPTNKRKEGKLRKKQDLVEADEKRQLGLVHDRARIHHVAHEGVRVGGAGGVHDIDDAGWHLPS